MNYEKHSLIAGVDEVGRGPLAGPVIAAAVILDPNHPIEGLKDSKQLSAKKREILFEEITQHALAWALGRAEVEEIDALNIHHASLLAMQRAVNGLSISPETALVDGKYAPFLECYAEPIVKGDETVPQISAASIIAKVFRDREMAELHKEYPEYGFSQHAGYPTKTHIQALLEHGPSPVHRKSFKPVRQWVEQQSRNV
jgi:ribonuclease HII